MEATVETTPERQAFYDDLSAGDMAPLWVVIRKLLTREPVTAAVPHVWRYDDVRPLILRSGELVTAEEAERRVLVLENPGLKGQSSITETLYAGLQLILPGEVAPAHRHSAAALRMIVEGEGAFTAVNGERAYMEPGDFIITPSWSWHDHGHEGAKPMVWLDGLDIPLVRFLGPIFAEGYGESQFPTNRPPGHSLTRYGANMRPVGDSFDKPHSPIFSYPYARTRDALTDLAKGEDPEPKRGYAMEYINPLTGGPVMPTMSTFMTHMPKGFKTEPRRTTEGQVYHVVEGTGRTVIETPDGKQTIEWGPKDTFVVPLWRRHHLEADGDSFLFSFTDACVQQALGIYREDA